MILTFSHDFTITIEVVPPKGPDAGPLLSLLESIGELPFQGFSVATNPVAKPCMSAMALCSLIQARTGRPAVLHCTTRDHNRLSLQGLLWGAKALGIGTVMAATGDMVAKADQGITSRVRDLDVFGLISMADQSGLVTGAVFDTHPEVDGFDVAVERLKRKISCGARFAVTQPVYDLETAERISTATRDMGIPVIMGILPLRTPKHAWFLHDKVAGIAVPEAVRKRMDAAGDSIAEGAANAREMLSVARTLFNGACIMPPFDHYEVLFDILS